MLQVRQFQRYGGMSKRCKRFAQIRYFTRLQQIYKQNKKMWKLLVENYREACHLHDLEILCDDGVLLQNIYIAAVTLRIAYDHIRANDEQKGGLNR
jgi:hypothetical protein